MNSYKTHGEVHQRGADARAVVLWLLVALIAEVVTILWLSEHVFRS